MKTLKLDGRAWRTREDVYGAVLQALGAPDWHGHNLDALEESLRDGDINRVNPPLVLQIAGVSSMGAEAHEVLGRFEQVATDLRAQGTEIFLELAQ